MSSDVNYASYPYNSGWQPYYQDACQEWYSGYHYPSPPPPPSSVAPMQYMPFYGQSSTQIPQTHSAFSTQNFVLPGAQQQAGQQLLPPSCYEGAPRFSLTAQGGGKSSTKNGREQKQKENLKKKNSDTQPSCTAPDSSAEQRDPINRGEMSAARQLMRRCAVLYQERSGRSLQTRDNKGQREERQWANTWRREVLERVVELVKTLAKSGLGVKDTDENALAVIQAIENKEPIDLSKINQKSKRVRVRHRGGGGKGPGKEEDGAAADEQEQEAAAIAVETSSSTDAATINKDETLFTDSNDRKEKNTKTTHERKNNDISKSKDNNTKNNVNETVPHISDSALDESIPWNGTSAAPTTGDVFWCSLISESGLPVSGAKRGIDKDNYYHQHHQHSNALVTHGGSYVFSDSYVPAARDSFLHEPFYASYVDSIAFEPVQAMLNVQEQQHQHLHHQASDVIDNGGASNFNLYSDPAPSVETGGFSYVSKLHNNAVYPGTDNSYCVFSEYGKGGAGTTGRRGQYQQQQHQRAPREDGFFTGVDIEKSGEAMVDSLSCFALPQELDFKGIPGSWMIASTPNLPMYGVTTGIEPSLRFPALEGSHGAGSCVSVGGSLSMDAALLTQGAAHVPPLPTCDDNNAASSCVPPPLTNTQDREVRGGVTTAGSQPFFGITNAIGAKPEIKRKEEELTDQSHSALQGAVVPLSNDNMNGACSAPPSFVAFLPEGLDLNQTPPTYFDNSNDTYRLHRFSPEAHKNSENDLQILASIAGLHNRIAERKQDIKDGLRCIEDEGYLLCERGGARLLHLPRAHDQESVSSKSATGGETPRRSRTPCEDRDISSNNINLLRLADVPDPATLELAARRPSLDRQSGDDSWRKGERDETAEEPSSSAAFVDNDTDAGHWSTLTRVASTSSSPHSVDAEDETDRESKGGPGSFKLNKVMALDSGAMSPLFSSSFYSQPDGGFSTGPSSFDSNLPQMPGSDGTLPPAYQSGNGQLVMARSMSSLSERPIAHGSLPHPTRSLTHIITSDSVVRELLLADIYNSRVVMRVRWINGALSIEKIVADRHGGVVSGGTAVSAAAAAEAEGEERERDTTTLSGDGGHVENAMGRKARPSRDNESGSRSRESSAFRQDNELEHIEAEILRSNRESRRAGKRADNALAGLATPQNSGESDEVMVGHDVTEDAVYQSASDGKSQSGKPKDKSISRSRQAGAGGGGGDNATAAAPIHFTRNYPLLLRARPDFEVPRLITASASSYAVDTTTAPATRASTVPARHRAGRPQPLPPPPSEDVYGVPRRLLSSSTSEIDFARSHMLGAQLTVAPTDADRDKRFLSNVLINIREGFLALRNGCDRECVAEIMRRTPSCETSQGNEEKGVFDKKQYSRDVEGRDSQLCASSKSYLQQGSTVAEVGSDVASQLSSPTGGGAVLRDGAGLNGKESLGYCSDVPSSALSVSNVGALSKLGELCLSATPDMMSIDSSDYDNHIRGGETASSIDVGMPGGRGNSSHTKTQNISSIITKSIKNNNNNNNNSNNTSNYCDISRNMTSHVSSSSPAMRTTSPCANSTCTPLDGHAQIVCWHISSGLDLILGSDIAILDLSAPAFVSESAGKHISPTSNSTSWQSRSNKMALKVRELLPIHESHGATDTRPPPLSRSVGLSSEIKSSNEGTESPARALVRAGDGAGGADSVAFDHVPATCSDGDASAICRDGSDNRPVLNSGHDSNSNGIHSGALTTRPVVDKKSGVDAVATIPEEEDTLVLSNKDALEYWFDSVIANVPYVGVVLHRDGIVRRVDIRNANELLLEIPQGIRIASEALCRMRQVLHWLVMQCANEGSDYIFVHGDSGRYDLYEVKPSTKGDSSGKGGGGGEERVNMNKSRREIAQ